MIWIWLPHVSSKTAIVTSPIFVGSIVNFTPFSNNRSYSSRISATPNIVTGMPSANSFFRPIPSVISSYPSQKAPFIWVLNMKMHCKPYRHCLIPLVTTRFTTMSVRVCNRIVTRIRMRILMHMLEMLVMHICYMLRMNMWDNCFWKSMIFTTVSRMHNWRHHICFTMKHH